MQRILEWGELAPGSLHYLDCQRPDQWQWRIHDDWGPGATAALPPMSQFFEDRLNARVQGVICVGFTPLAFA